MWRAWTRAARVVAAHGRDVCIATHAPEQALALSPVVTVTRASSRFNDFNESAPSPSAFVLDTRPRAHLAGWRTPCRHRAAEAHGTQTRAYASKVKRGVRVTSQRVTLPVMGSEKPDLQSSDAINPTANPKKPETPPALKDAMRKLVRVVHPDLFASGPPGASAVNDESLKTIQGVLDAVTKSRQIPDAGIKRLRFYVKDSGTPEGVRVVPFTFKTTGGDCRNLVKKQLSQLFSEVGIPPEFKWGADDWTHDPESAENAQARGDPAPGWDLYPSARGHSGGSGDFHDGGNTTTRGNTDTANAHETAGNTPGAFMSRDATYMDDAERDTSTKTDDAGSKMSRKRRSELQGALKVNDKLFEAIAAVPWIPEPNGDDRVFVINTEIAPRLRKEGWRITSDVIEKIWRGERDESVVMDGLDAASGLAIAAIVKHSRNFDRAYGTPNVARRDFYPEPGRSTEDLW